MCLYVISDRNKMSFLPQWLGSRGNEEKASIPTFEDSNLCRRIGVLWKIKTWTVIPLFSTHQSTINIKVQN